MCQLKSGILLKDRVFIPDYDSHEDMLKELKIEDTEDNAKRLFVRAELIPPNDNVFTPVSKWKYRVDQDILPDWYVPEIDEKRMRNAVAEWAKEHIHVGEKIEEITSGLHWIKDGTVGTISGSAKVELVSGSAKVVNIFGSAKVEKIFGSAEVEKIFGSAEVVNIFGFAEVEKISGFAKVENICDSAKVVNIFSSAEVGYVYGSAKVGSVYDTATVENICGLATVENICGSAKVGSVYDTATVGSVYDTATVMTDSVSKWYNADAVCIKDEAVLIDRYNKKIYHSGAFETVIAGGKKGE
nr:MAG TPA: hypothetical protein [Caudoviricetes sp.]